MSCDRVGYRGHATSCLNRRVVQVVVSYSGDAAAAKDMIGGQCTESHQWLVEVIDAARMTASAAAAAATVAVSWALL